MRLAALAALAACSSRTSPPPPAAGGARVTLPASATEVHTEDAPAGLRDARTVTTFCLAPDRRAELATLPCTPGPDRCVWRKLHTEVSVQVEDRGKELFVTVVDSEYDNCLFEGCAKRP